jgi:hypothetical protein
MTTAALDWPVRTTKPAAANAAAIEGDDHNELMERDFMVYLGLFFIFGILCGLLPVLGNVNIILQFEGCTRKIFRKFHEVGTPGFKSAASRDSDRAMFAARCRGPSPTTGSRE